MPDGVEVAVDGDWATIDFVDRGARGPGLARLLEHAEPSDVETLTRGGPRTRYRVPVVFARKAGLLDRASRVDALASPDTSSATDATGSTPPGWPASDRQWPAMLSEVRGSAVRFGVAYPGLDESVLAQHVVPSAPAPNYDDGLPDMDWSRRALNDYAARLTPPVKAVDLPNKRAVIAAIDAAVGGGAKRPAPPAPA